MDTGKQINQTTEEGLRINGYERQFKEPELRQLVERKEEDRWHQAGRSIEEMKSIAGTRDILEENERKKPLASDEYYLTSEGFVELSISESSWLKSQTIPKEAELEKEITDAAKIFGISSLSRSEMTKRGKKFKKKALQQAKMINLMKKCKWQRDEALEDLLEHGRHARLAVDETRYRDENGVEKSVEYLEREDDTFLGKTGRLDEIKINLNDLSFFYEQQRVDNEGKKKDVTAAPAVTEEMYRPLELIADPDTRIKGYKMVLDDFDKLDLSMFEYKDNEEFIKNDGKNSFVKRYAALRAFSNLTDMIKEVGVEELGEERYVSLLTKTEIFHKIFSDYENRALLIQSPYYVLLAGKDFDKFNYRKLNDILYQSKDPLVRGYIKKILDKKAFEKQSMSAEGFTKGTDTKKLYKALLVEVKKSYGRSTLTEKEVEYKKTYEDDQVFLKELTASCTVSLKRNRKLLSLRFKNMNNLIPDDIGQLEEEERKLMEEYEKARDGSEAELTLAEWLDHELDPAVCMTDFTEAAKAADLNYLHLDDPLVLFSRNLIPRGNSYVSALMNEGKFKKDASGEVMREHLKEYSRSSFFRDSTANTDVENLINNILVKDIMKEEALDLYDFSNDMLVYMKAYSLLVRYMESFKLEAIHGKEMCRMKLAQTDILIEREPENIELKDLKTKLEKEEADASRRVKFADSVILSIRSKVNTPVEYWLEKQQLRAINKALIILEQETPGKYRDKMNKLLLARKEELEKKVAVTDSVIFTPENKAVKEPMTENMKELLLSTAEDYDRIMKCRQDGDEDSALEILDNIRVRFYDFKDEEYMKRYGL